MKKLLIAFNIVVVAIAVGATLMNGCTPANNNSSESRTKVEHAEHPLQLTDAAIKYMSGNLPVSRECLTLKEQLGLVK